MVRKLARLMAALAVLTGLGMLFCWFVAIWSPWGRADDWGVTGLLLMMITLGLGIGSAAMLDFVEEH
jgi:hypothetical protein